MMQITEKMRLQRTGRQKIELSKIYKALFWAVLTISVAFLTLLYPIVNKEKVEDGFIVQIKKFKQHEDFSKFKQRDINKSIRKAEDALNNIYSFESPFKAISFKNAWESSSPLPYISKKYSAYSDFTHEYLAQSLGILYDLIATHQKSKDIRFLEKGYEIIGNWAKNNTRFDIFQSKIMWNDHVASNRIIAILLFNDYSSQYIEPADAQQNIINKIFEDSISHLASPYNYKYKHNHGIFQDLALLISSEYLLDKEKRKTYSTIALDRFAQQVRDTYTGDGIHLENSPGYHLAITDLLNTFVSQAKSYGFTIDPEILKIIALANKNKYFFVLNNGNVAPVGDSSYVPYGSFEQLKEEVLISQDAGYVFFKDKTNYLLIRTQSINDVHDHQDQLSFIYEDQKNLIVSEPGFLGYGSSKEIIFVRSRKAHNTVYSKDQKNMNYYFNKVLNNEQFFYCQVLSADNSISRTFLLDKKSKVLVVQDVIKNHEEEKLFEILNLSSDVVNVNNNKDYQEIIMANNHKYYTRSFQYGDPIDSKVLYGSTKPFFGGWRTIPYKKLVPAYTLLSTLDKKKEIQFSRVISLNQIDTFYDINNTITTLAKRAKVVPHSRTLFSKNPFPILDKIEKKIKNRIQPLFFKRIIIFIDENIIIMFLLLIYILFRKEYINWSLYLLYVVVSLFNIFVFFTT